MDPQQDHVQIKTAADTTEAIRRLDLRRQRARTLARPDPATVAPQSSLTEALDQMRRQGGDALLIKDGERLVGILTERDVLTRVFGAGADFGRPVADFMTADPNTLPADASLFDAMQAMERGHYRNVPLVDEQGMVVGLLRQQDLLEYIAEAFPQEILNLPPRPHQLMDQPEGA